MTIQEPTTMATDYLLALLCFFLAGRLCRENKAPRQDSVSLWALGLAATGAASLLGGTYHGLGHHLHGPARVLLWKGTLAGIGMMSLFMLCAALTASLRRPWFLAAAALKFFAFAFWIAGHDEFKYAVWDYVPAMLLVLALLHGNRWIVAGVLVSFAAAGAQLAGLGLGAHLNHNDVYHVTQMIGVWLVYRGGRFLKDQA